MKVTKKAKWIMPAMVFFLSFIACLTLVSCLDAGAGGSGNNYGNFNPVGRWLATDSVHTLIIMANGTCTISYMVSYGVGNATTFRFEEIGGTHSVSGNIITLNFSGVGQFTGMSITGPLIGEIVDMNTIAFNYNSFFENFSRAFIRS